MSQSKNPDQSNKKKEQPKLYYDTNKSKGNTFEKNINLINNMYFGQGINITDNPFITLSEKDQNKYLSVQQFAIKKDKDTVLKEVFIPGSFLQPVFYYENILFHVTNENKLLVVKLDEKSYTIFTFQDKKIENNQTIENENSVNIIKKKLKNLNNIIDISKKYETLIDIFTKDLDCSLTHKTPKNIKKTFKINIGKDMNYIIEIENFLDTQIDDFGILREQIKLCRGQISFKDGINFLKSYVKGEKNKTDFTSNDFKCPIIYKNFSDEIIPQDNAILFEMKSGFELKDVVSQLNKRIIILNNCVFIDNKERPVFYIGLVNILSNNIDKETQDVITNISLNANLLLVVCVDYKYCGIDVSREIHGEYLLYKKINSLEHKMDSNFRDLNNKIDTNYNELNKKIDTNYNELNKKMDTNYNELNKKIDTNYNELNKKIDTLQEQIQSLIDFMKMNYPNFQEVGMNGFNSKNLIDNNDN